MAGVVEVRALPLPRLRWESAAWCHSWSDSGRTAYTILGASYAALAAAMFVGAAVHQREVKRALDLGGFADVSDNAALALTLVATVLALGTLAVIVAQP